MKLGELEKFSGAPNEETDTSKDVVSEEIEIDEIGLRLLGLNKETRSKFNILKMSKEL